MRLFAAPLQGFTEHPWREAHAAYAGGIDRYFAPFCRVEKGEVRRRDLRDVGPDASTVVGQAIFRDVSELSIVISALAAEGVGHVDLNLGCPFPPQNRKGRGAAILARPDVLAGAEQVMRQFPDMKFSAKMRLGLTDRDEWRRTIPVLNSMPLEFLTVHPRIASQQYSGSVDLDAFGMILEESAHPVVYNGDITTPDDIARIADRYPTLHGIMIGRGLLARPSLAAEYHGGSTESTGLCRLDWPDSQRSDSTECTPDHLALLLKIHDHILRIYTTTLCGDAQILQKIKPFWTYAAPILPRSLYKSLHKSTTLSAYLRNLQSYY